LKNSLSEIAGEEECIRPVRAKCREESQMGDADVSCASSTTAKSKGGVLLEAMAQASLVNISETVITPREARSARHSCEHGPESDALLFREPRLSSHSPTPLMLTNKSRLADNSTSLSIVSAMAWSTAFS
jgi:hypothetical protein